MRDSVAGSTSCPSPSPSSVSPICASNMQGQGVRHLTAAESNLRCLFGSLPNSRIRVREGGMSRSAILSYTSNTRLFEAVASDPFAGLLCWLSATLLGESSLDLFARVKEARIQKPNCAMGYQRVLLMDANSGSYDNLLTDFRAVGGEVGKWIAFVAVVIQLFFPNLVREKLELPAAIVILLVTLPNLVAVHFRNSILAIFVSLGMGGYLLHQHIQAAGGFRNAFAGKKGMPVTIGILLLFVSPLWDAVRSII